MGSRLFCNGGDRRTSWQQCGGGKFRSSCYAPAGNRYRIWDRKCCGYSAWEGDRRRKKERGRALCRTFDVFGDRFWYHWRDTDFFDPPSDHQKLWIYRTDSRLYEELFIYDVILCCGTVRNLHLYRGRASRRWGYQIRHGNRCRYFMGLFYFSGRSGCICVEAARQDSLLYPDE